MKKNNKILFLSSVHGNESFSIKILKRLKKENKDKFDFLIANEKAIKKNIRFIDADLNRIAPGKNKSKKYEIQRAFEILKICKNYKYVIDIHGTEAATGIFIIITNPKKKNLLLAASLPINKIVIWSDKKVKKTGPLTRFMDNAVEIECGPKKTKEIQSQLDKIIKAIIKQDINFDKNLLTKKNIFEVYGKLSEIGLSKKTIKQIKEFKKIIIEKESFYPLLVGRYKDVACYKMRKINK